MADVYQRFLQSPSASLLSADASLHYITTTTSIHQPEAIIKHLQAQEKQIEKKSQKVLSCTEGANGVCLETETTMKFVRGGGVILPQMDDNMLADMVAVCPMVHIVELDASRKISQIRLYWDQGTMLKQVEAIGKSGRNWPIRDGKEQIKLIQQSAANQRSTFAGAAAKDSSRAPKKDDYNSRLFATGVEGDDRSASHDPTIIPRESAKPQPRQWDELFSGQSEEATNSYTNSGLRSPEQPMLKGGAGKNFQANRLFDSKELSTRERAPDQRKQDPTKFDHFEFGDGEDTPAARGNPSSRKNNDRSNNWDSEDFVTPQKNAQRANPEQDRHIGYGIDEEDPKSIHRRNPSHPPRPDANAHFRIADERSPAAKPKGPLDTITNVNRRQKEDAHFNIGKASPATENRAPGPDPNAKSNKPRNDMSSNWNFADMEQTPTVNKKIYKTAGDGMGGRAGSRLWDVAGDDAPDHYGGKDGEKQVYKTAGNGMGGKKGTGLSWSIGDDDA